MTPPAISVIVPVRNEFSRLHETILSIAVTRSSGMDCEVVIVDDASSDDRYSSLRRHRASKLSINVVRSERRLGVARARNLGATAAVGKILLITDSHVELCQSWDEIILGSIAQDRILAATIADPTSGFKGYGCSLVVPFMGTKWNQKKPRKRASVQIASSAGTAIHRDLFWRLGGYDSGMVLYGGAEPEFSLRAWLNGQRIVSLPEFEIMHRFKSPEGRKTFLRGLRPIMMHNNLRFGLLYLSNLASLQMLRHYAMKFPRHMREACAMLETSDVWERRRVLRQVLRYNFAWYVNRFDLTDQIGRRIL